MSLYNDYAAFTATTAVYPTQVAAEYLSLGLCSEAAECVEVDADVRVSISSVQRGNTIGKEIGDVQWYAARMSDVYNLDFDTLVNDAKKAYVPGFDISLSAILRDITVESGLVAGKVKKQLRDGATWTGEQREEVRQYIRARLIKIIGLSMLAGDWMYANHCDEFSSYDKILKMNRRKLEGRVERGTIRGSGDNR